MQVSINTSDRRTDNTVTVTEACGHDAVQETQTNRGMYIRTMAQVHNMLHDCVCSSAAFRTSSRMG